MKLGKKEYREDERTLRLTPEFMATPPGVTIPDEFDFDVHRSTFPTHNGWGNFDYGDCVLAGRANNLVRLERIETRHTVPLTEEMVVDKYKAMTGCQSPGDANDTGLVVLDALSDWRAGWPLDVYKNPRTYKIAAYGLLNERDREQLRTATFLLDGIQFGLALPWSANAQISNGQAWDVDDSADGEPGSWGGHLVYAKHYDSGGIYCITWGREQYMTNAFIEKYCDEAWVVVDDLETRSKYVDVAKLTQYLHDIGASNIG
jgi:hypothetical protein